MDGTALLFAGVMRLAHRNLVLFLPGPAPGMARIRIDARTGKRAEGMAPAPELPGGGTPVQPALQPAGRGCLAVVQ